MKKVITILEVVMLVMVMLIGNYVVEAENNRENDVKFGGTVVGGNPSEVYQWLAGWIESCGDTRALDKDVDENNFYRGYGVLIKDEFESEHGIPLTIGNLRKAMTESDEYIIDDFDVKLAGFYEDYSVYEMTVKATEKPIGYTYYYDSETYTEEYTYYYEGMVYFMVVE